MQHPDEQEPTAEALAEYLHDEYYGDEEPEYDDPSNRLHYSELHPLIGRAAAEAWRRADYAGAVDKAWLAMRDEIQRRAARPDLDGIDLVNQGIGETSPRLPLTDFVTETDKNMHRGLVSFLRGSVYYIRNPEAHESTSPVAGDKEGAFERLALLSLCARHVVGSAPPTAIADALQELRQPRFPKRRQAYEDLLSGVPVRRHAEFAAALVEASVEAYTAGKEIHDTLAAMYRHIIERSDDESIDSASAQQLRPLISNDGTLELAVRLLTPQAAARLEDRNRWKVHELLVHEINVRKINDPEFPGGLASDIARLVPGMPSSGLAEVVDAYGKALVDDDAMRAVFGLVTLVRFVEELPSDAQDELARVIAEHVISDPKGLIVQIVDDPEWAVPTGFRTRIATLRERLTAKELGEPVALRALLDVAKRESESGGGADQTQ